MKKAILILAVILLLNILVIPASAANTPFSVDNEHRYEGMMQTYASGYLPVIENGSAKIVLPLVTDEPLVGNKVRVSVNLGSTSGSPFVYRSYETDFSLADNPVDGGSATVSSYLVHFELNLKSQRINGVYPVTLSVLGEETDGTAISQSFTVYVNITDGKDPGGEDTSLPEHKTDPVIISIDSDNVYQNMNKPYSDGYTPKVENGYAQVVLPLKAEGDISGSMTVSPDLGNPADSPFVISNYQQTVTREGYKFNNKSMYVYLAAFSFLLKPDRINGTYPIVFTVSAKDIDGTSYQKTFTVYVTVTDGKALSQPLTISLDNENKYEGMDSSYSAGYTPKVEQDKAKIVLPIFVGGSIDGGLTVTPDLGDTASAPFVISNYEMNVTGTHHAIDGKDVFSYVAYFNIPLKPDRVNGSYPVVFNVGARCEDGSTVQKTFQVFVTITDGQDPNAKPDGAQSDPKIIIDGLSLNKSPIMAGDTFNAVITLKNTSMINAVSNLTVTASSADKGIIIEDSSNTYYIDKIGPGKTTELPIRLMAGRDLQDGRYNMDLAFSYDDDKDSKLSFDSSFFVDVSQPLDVQLEMPDIGKEVTAGDTLSLTFKFINMGRGPVYNARCEMEAPGLFPGGTAYIGAMDAGTEKSADMNVFIGSLDMSKDYKGSGKYGFTQGKVTLFYDDQSGEEHHTDYDISTVINAPSQPQEDTVDKQQMAGQWWESLIILGLIIAASLGYIIFRGKRNENRQG